MANSAFQASASSGGGNPTIQANQTANFTAVAGNLYPVSPSSAIITATLPTSTVGQQIYIKNMTGTFAVNVFGTINGAASSTLPLRTLDQGKLFIADLTGGWLPYSTDIALSSLDLRYIQISALTAGANVTLTGAGTTASPYVIAATASGGFTNPMTTQGDTIYGGTAGAATRLAAGTTSQVHIGGTTPSWGAVNLASMVTGITPVANGGTGSATQNFVDLTTAQVIQGQKTLITNAATWVAASIAQLNFGDTATYIKNTYGGDTEWKSGATNMVINSVTGSFQVKANGTNMLTVTSAVATISGQMQAPFGSVTTSLYLFVGSTSSGMFMVDANTMALSASGIKVMDFYTGNTRIQNNVYISGTNGLQFTSGGASGSSPDSTISRLAAGSLAIGNGTIGDISGKLTLNALRIAITTAFVVG